MTGLALVAHLYFRGRVLAYQDDGQPGRPLVIRQALMNPLFHGLPDYGSYCLSIDQFCGHWPNTVSTLKKEQEFRM